MHTPPAFVASSLQIRLHAVAASSSPLHHLIGISELRSKTLSEHIRTITVEVNLSILAGIVSFIT
jgi:hypothetical protein